MRKSIVCTYIIAFLFLHACCQQHKIEYGKIQENIKVKSDTSLSYSIYLPTKKISLAFIFFDPHGNGLMPISLYKNIADEFGIILIGNNNSSNGTDVNIIASNFSTLLNEIKTNYKIEERSIALWGFSGGAKAAIYNAGLNNAINYCVYGGSVANPQNNIELLGFNGQQDMNYTDLLSFSSQQQNNPKHFQIEFLGIHAWPDTIIAKDAFRWFLLKKMEKKEFAIDKNLVSKSYAIYKKQVDNLILTKQYTDAFLTCNKAIHFLNNLTDITYFNTKKSFLIAQPIFKTQVQNFQNNFEKESKIKMQYQTDIFAKDTIYWKKEIADLWLKSTTDKSGMYNRLLGFLSLAGYSYANRAFQENDIKALEQILCIYHYADPTNPEQAFMHAKLFAIKNENDNAKQALNEAIQLGINTNRIENDVILKRLQ